ncbi:MAG: helix-turn-helix transcriptional regulator [Clostridia bacterium]|nr:helix-turn-helix transcriptional regulator [Clostridia bacterium]
MHDFHISLQSLPNILFAHEFSSDNYRFSFPAQSNFIELSYLIEGDIEVHRKNGVYTVPQGSVMIWMRNQDQHTLSHTRQSHVTVGFHIEYINGNDLCLPEFLPNADKKFRSDIAAIVNEYNLQEKNTTELCARILQLLANVSTAYESKRNKCDDYGIQLYRAKAEQYIVAHLKEKIRVSDVAQALQLSESYLSEIFHRATGQTLIEYVNRKKLTKVKELVTAMHCPMRVAAEQMGFDDPNYVSRLYRKYFGVPFSSRTDNKSV